MNKPNSDYQDVFDKIYLWLQKAKQDELNSIKSWVAKAEEVIDAAEELSINEFQLSVDSFKQDLVGLYKLNQQDADNSLYLRSLQEGLWQKLAQMTDQSQVEWSELVDDFSHDGIYHEGDSIGFGQLVCRNCQHEVDIYHAVTIVACTECGSTEFSRKAF